MIVEYIRYKIANVARKKELIYAYEAAQESLGASPHLSLSKSPSFFLFIHLQTSSVNC
jgi:hypothetical protein